MKSELVEALHKICEERGIDPEVLFNAIEEGLVSAYKREFLTKGSDNITASVDRETGEMAIYVTREVVEIVDDPQTQISLAEAKAMSDDFEIGDELEMMIDYKSLGRLAAQTAKSVITQRLAQAERERIHREFSSRIGQLVYGVVQRRDYRDVIVDIERVEALLPAKEQSRLDSYDSHQHMQFCIQRVEEGRGRTTVIVSRANENLVRRLFEKEVPEIGDGLVQIVSVSRDAGSRTKIAVYSHDPNVDAIGACVGPRGMRVQNVIDELHNEKIDIVEWSEITEDFIANAISPARISRVELHENNVAKVVVPDSQLSLAIGRSGQNAKLASRLTGWKIDIKSESQINQAEEREMLARLQEAFADEEVATEE